MRQGEAAWFMATVRETLELSVVTDIERDGISVDDRRRSTRK
jgi:hypothetical protein